MTTYRIKPLTADLWPALEELFGPVGACNGCWCMYWRIGSAYNKRPRDANRKDFRAVVKKGPPPGLLAFEGDKAVGWIQVTPRASLPGLENGRFTRAIDETPVWSISCFYIRKGYRGKGVSRALIDAAIDHARKARAPALEAYPTKTDRKRSNAGMYTGLASSFEKAGFRTIASPAPHRPMMRLSLASPAKSTGRGKREQTRAVR
jgi:GNAT superfamily N-acetyltransferase